MAALVVVAACSDEEVTSIRPQLVLSEGDYAPCYSSPSCTRGAFTLATDASGSIGTGTVAVVLWGSQQLDATKVKLGATRVELYINDSKKPVTYNKGSIISFIEHYGVHRLNLNLASLATDTIRPTPPPPPPEIGAGLVRDINSDGLADIVFFIPVGDLVKGGLTEGTNSIILRVSGAGVSGGGFVGGGSEAAATDSIRVVPPPPPPVGEEEIVTHG